MSSNPFSSTPLLHRLHRWGGLLAACILLFYGLTGIILNHRQAFDYFQTSQRRDLSVPKGELSAVNAFIDQYRQVIDRPDAPEVIRIKNGKTVELLYGSHGQTTYTIDPSAGTMRVESKRPSQPLYLFNSLHKAAKTKLPWLWLSDALSLAMLVSVLAILFAMRYRPLDLCLLATGALLCLLGGFLA